MATHPKQSSGGRARAQKLTREERSQAARRAAQARWAKGEDVPAVICGSPDQPLRIGDLEIPCYVLDDERRVIVQRGVMSALDMSQGTAGRGDGDRLSRFLATRALSPFVTNELRDVITSPIRFRSGPSLAYGYEATVLADICDVVLQARKEGKLHYQQEHIAQQCEMLLRAFAKVGIVALVDEATGYQYVRQRDALSQLLEEFLSEELRRWVKTFPGSYFKEMCRLKGVPYRPDMRLPQYFGHLTNDVVYKRLAPGVLDALKEKSPKDGKGNRPNKLHQWLSEGVGHPKLIQHLGTVIGLMRISRTWDEFKGYLDQAAPAYDNGHLFIRDDD